MCAEHRTPKPSRQLSILLVGEHQVILQAMKTWLAPLGHQLTWVQDGLAAIGQIRKQHFDIVVTDLDMPGLDGSLISQYLHNSNDPATIIELGSRWYRDDPATDPMVGPAATGRKETAV